MLEQEHMTSPPVYMNNKRFKQSENKPAESFIKYNRPKISEKLKREIELYNYERRGYNNYEQKKGRTLILMYCFQCIEHGIISEKAGGFLA